MEKSTGSDVFPGEAQGQNLNRRELLKVLAAAGGGLAAAAFLPGNWIKPLVEIGVLPGHAQFTRTLLLSELEIERRAPKSQAPLREFYGDVNYYDELHRVGIDTTTLYGSTSPSSLSDFIFNRTGNSTSGYFHFEFNASCNSVFSTYFQVGGRTSAPVSENLTDVCYPPT